MDTAGQELQKLRECCICLKEFTDPRMLPCIHTFCLECLKHIGDTAGKQPGESAPCPLCRGEFVIPADGMDGLQKNFFMQHLIDVKTMLSLNSTSVIHCDICKTIYKDQDEETKPATMRCLECGDNYCDFCSKAHKLQKLSSGHHVLKIGSETEDDTRKMFLAKNCNDHKQKPLDYYCPECRRLVCVSCLLENHVSHKCKDVTSIEEELRETIEKNALMIASNAEELLLRERSIDQRKEEFVAGVMKIEYEIKKRHEELKDMVDKHTSALLEEICLLKQTQLKKFQMEKEEIERVHTIFKSFEAYSTELCSKGSASDICGCFDDLFRRAKELCKDHDEYLGRPCESIKVSFQEKDLRAPLGKTEKNIVGKIEEITSRFKTYVTVFGLCDGDTKPSKEVVAINLHRSNEISKLQLLPNTISHEAAIAVHDNTMYVTGIGSTADEIWKYNMASGWKQCASLGQGRRRHSAAFINEVLYICGGIVDSSKPVLDSVEAFNAITNKCARVGKLILGLSHYENCVPFKSCLYMFGVKDRHEYRVQVYNTKDNTCTLLSKAMAYSLNWMRAVLLDTSVILIGVDTCFIFNLETGVWQERTQFKTDVDYFGLILDNERVFVIGGGNSYLDEDGEKRYKCRDDVRYVPLRNIIEDRPIEWQFHATLPRPSLIDICAKLTLSVV